MADTTRDLTEGPVWKALAAMSTPMMLGMKDRNPQMWDQLNASVPFPKRLGEPEEFGSLIVEIARNTYINGHQFRLDGAIRMPPK